MKLGAASASQALSWSSAGCRTSGAQLDAACSACRTTSTDTGGIAATSIARNYSRA
jgi:hypothetical protein